MNSLIIINITILLLLLSSVSCTSPRGLLLFEEKTRLGSMPPSCHNKCNQCHPCLAVQVPSLPSHQPGRPMELFKPSSSSSSLSPLSSNNRYSNYKPLGWKCHCNGHFYNP